jgi:hypothetical protein
MGSNVEGKKGLRPPPQQAAAPAVHEIRQYPVFGFAIERAGPTGEDRILAFSHPDGIRRDYPLEAEAAKQMSERLLAPSVPGSDGVVLPPGAGKDPDGN